MQLPFTTYFIVGLTCLVSLLAFDNKRLMGELILWPPAIYRKGQWYRLITYGMVHANGTHLLVNMITLYFFGRVIEDVLAGSMGGFGFAVFYLSALAASILPSYAAHREDEKYFSLGASGAVSAALFAFVLLRPWSTINVFFALPMPAIVYAVIYVGYSIWADRRGKDRINHSAHLWGALYGVAFLLVLHPEALRSFLDQLARPSMGS
jgi:membrane associated rhomboid family serine protease